MKEQSIIRLCIPMVALEKRNMVGAITGITSIIFKLQSTKEAKQKNNTLF